jgi:hypothetical protein
MPGQHPDDDLLADLAADVLPLDQARTVEAHVMSCDRCAALLSDAEHVRGLLLADDAGPVPPEIWNRIEAALRTAAPSTPVESSLAGSPPPPNPPPARRVDAVGPSGWDGADPLDDPNDWATAVQPKVPPRGERVPEPVIASVRPLSASRRSTRPDRRLRSGPLLVGAAAAIVLLLAVGTVRLLQSGRGGPAAAFDSGESAAGNSSSAPASGAVAGATITRSNADYTSATLAQQARTLVSGATKNRAQGNPGEGGSPSHSTAPAPRAMTGASVAANPQAQDVTNPQRLSACLKALGASPDAVVAVDLARFKGREAAVLVLRAQSGYEVWVVERTCQAGDEGALAETTIPG